MLFRTFIRILTSLIRDFCTSDRNFASTFFQIPPHDGHPWSWLGVGHCDYNPHNRLSLSRYMPCPAYEKMNKVIPCSSLSLGRNIQTHHPYRFKEHSYFVCFIYNSTALSLLASKRPTCILLCFNLTIPSFKISISFS